MQIFRTKSSLHVFMFILFLGCTEEKEESSTGQNTTDSSFQRFALLPPEHTKIDFRNTLVEGPNTNILMYEYFYNGGGVATGDLNGDDLIDIYFTSNMGKNKVYLNKGNMVFQDITTISGASGREGPWKTGVSMVDINGDAKLDIYVCYSGMVRDENRVNQLFINQGNDEKGIPRFIEKAKEAGLASAAYSNQAYFFDYDRDGDLDAMLLNHNPKSLPILNEVSTAQLLKINDPLKGVRLFNQANGFFQDVTTSAGISGSELTYGLGVGIADVNNDGWQDFYISNDYAVPDYLYINNKNGTFTDQLKDAIGHNSQFSMGNDIADINNDGLQDIITLDMLPEDNQRQKLLMAPDNYAKFDLNVRSGFHYQYMRNMLQVNNGNGTFSEVGQLAGISNTDWSWAALIADYDNDGYKDLFVTNGYLKDYTNLDFIKYMDDFVKGKGRLKRDDVLELINHMPASNVVNYIFSNTDGIRFKNQTKSWGMDRPSNSNGASYADLDNDGDLDIVVNNVNQPAFIYRNESDKKANHFLTIKLVGEKLNSNGLGAKVAVTSNGRTQYLEQMPTRGYLSSVSPVLHVGLEATATIDTLLIQWLSGKQHVMTNVKADQMVTLYEKDAKVVKKKEKQSTSLFVATEAPIRKQSQKSTVNDFKRQPLLMNQLSFGGPCIIKGDVNNDGLADVFAGSGKDEASALFVQQKNKTFKQKHIAAFEEDKGSVDADAVFFDANGDGHLDLYVASGGYHSYSPNDKLLQDRLYINDGTGNFTKSRNALPEMFVSKGCVAVGDVNGDTHTDLFVGGRVIPGRYPETPRSYLLINDGKGNFKDEINNISPELKDFGMITDAIWADIDGDRKRELIITGEWLPISVFENENGKLKNSTLKYFDKEYRGWWNKIDTADFNNDHKADLIVGNAGTNTQCKVSDKEPAELYFKDFDNNGSVDPFFCFYIQGISYPYVTRDELLEQIGNLRSRFNSYKSYSTGLLSDIFKAEELKSAEHLSANHLETTLFLSTDNKFQTMSLPLEAQYAPVHAIHVFDYNSDGNKDMLLCGNNSYAKIKTGKFDANYGVLLRGNGKGNFEYIKQTISGFKIKGDVRSVIDLNGLLIFGVTQQPLQSYRLR